MATSSVKSLAWVAGATIATVLGADLALQRIDPLPPRLQEVEDGVADLDRSNPDLLILGSSHTRSFIPLAEDLDARGNHKTVLVPVEWGTFSSYNWVLQNRVRPLLDEKDGAGRYRRDRLKRAMLISTFYDLCSDSVIGMTLNLPARAWAFDHFAADLVRHGVTDFNRNYLTTRFKRMLGFSLLVQARGYDHILEAVHRTLKPPPPGFAEEEWANHVEHAARHMEDQFAYCDDADERRNLRQIVDYFKQRGVELVVVGFALMPSIVSEKSKQTTVKRYNDYVARLAQELGFRWVDMTFDTPLVDHDFQADFDHTTVPGRRKFSTWALEHDLSFLMEAGP